MTPQMMEMMKINDELETLALVQPQQRFEIKIFSGFVLYPGQAMLKSNEHNSWNFNDTFYPENICISHCKLF